MKRFGVVARYWILGGLLLACQGTVSGPGGANGKGGSGSGAGRDNAGSGSTGMPGGGAGNTSNASGGLDTGGQPNPTPPFEATTAATAVRKVKNLMVGLAPTSDEIASVTSSGAAGLSQLISKWMSDPSFQPFFRDKMVAFFRNAFQQTGFVPTEDFKHQLLENGGFDFGPFGTGAVGDDVFYRLVQNLEDSFALTAWQLVVENRPFSEVLTTRRFMMTTALKSLYVQIEMPNDQPFASFGSSKPQTVAWKIDMSGTDIPLSETLNPNSPNYMVFDDEAPSVASGFRGGASFNTCQGTAGLVNSYSGYANLFQRLIGFTQRYPFAASPQCWEHASKPYFEVSDTTDWGWVDISTKTSADTYPQPYDLPTLRTLKELKLALPRVGFFSTPAYLAIWNTNDSNQHRVTANQTLLVALGQSFTGDAVIVPVSTSGLDANHSVDGTECYGCHKSLDPMRSFWGSQLDFNDRNDFPQRGNFMGGAANPRPSKTGGIFAFGDVNVDKSGGTLHDLGALLLTVHDTSDASQPITRFAMSMTQKLCSFANSAPCLESDTEFRRVALSFEKSNFNFPVLIKELFSSALVTGASTTATFEKNGMTVSISRRDQFCQALSNRLGRPDICSQLVPLPSSAQKNTLNIANNIPADAFGRGSENLVTPSDPTLFFRAASEMLCEDIAVQVVDAPSNTVYSSSDLTNGIADMVQRIMGYPPSDPRYNDAVRILTEHYNAAKSASGGTATKAMQSTFAAACQSPTSLSFGL
ncbi:MAG: hypothetical protein ACOY0T_07795 [Myxococcota bacterium]